MTVPNPPEEIVHTSKPSLDLKALPDQLREHVVSYLQEELYAPALSLLHDVLASDVNAFGVKRRIIRLPSTQVLGLAATIIVHPSTTTRLSVYEKSEAADLAFRYLRTVSELGSPRENSLDQVLIFQADGGARGSRKRRRSLDDTIGSMLEHDGHLSTKIANEDGIFEKAEDFWSIVGWAFNCSAKHHKRWDRYSVFLELLLNVLERDLEDRRRQREYDVDVSGSAINANPLDQALLTTYLADSVQGRTRKRRVMRAILADGSSKSLAEFGEIWRNETKAPTQVDVATQSEKVVDFENDEYGDYMDLDDGEDLGIGSASERTRTTSGARSRRKQNDQLARNDDSSDDEEDAPDTGPASVDSVTAMRIRQRVLGLLTSYSQAHPHGWTDTEDLFDLYTEFLRPLPLRNFQQFILPSKAWMDPQCQTSLVQMILRPLISADAPKPGRGHVTQDDLEAIYLPFTANQANMADNAKVSILLEALMRLLWKHIGLVPRPSLTKAVEDGRKARLAKVGFDGRKKTQHAIMLEKEAQTVLLESSRRMAILLDML